MQFASPLSFALAAVVAFGLCGCGEDNGRIETHGTVTFDGEPVEDGSITFMPVDGKGVTTGAPIKHGKYRAEVSPGEMAVQIQGMKIVRKENPTPEEIERGLDEEKQNYIPGKYNSQSELRVTISEEKTEQNFDLKP